MKKRLQTSADAFAGRTRPGDVRTVAGIPYDATERADFATRGMAGTMTLVRNPGYTQREA